MVSRWKDYFFMCIYLPSPSLRRMTLIKFKITDMSKGICRRLRPAHADGAYIFHCQDQGVVVNAAGKSQDVARRCQQRRSEAQNVDLEKKAKSNKKTQPHIDVLTIPPNPSRTETKALWFDDSPP